MRRPRRPRRGSVTGWEQRSFVLADTVVSRATSPPTPIRSSTGRQNLMARRRTLVMTALAAGLLFSTAACGGDDNGGGSRGSGSSGGGDASGKVGVILPDTT